MLGSLMFKRLIGLGFALGLALLMLGGLWISMGGEILAAPLLKNVASDPEIRAITVTASLPISDSRPGQGIAKTIYFSNSTAGTINVTFQIAGTPELTFTPGVAFGQSHAAVKSADTVFTTTLDYAVSPTDTNTQGLYTVTNAMGQVVVPISYVRDVTVPVISMLNPAEGIFTGRMLEVNGTATDNPDGVGIQSVQITTDTMNWMTATGTTTWSSVFDLPTYDGTQYTISACATDHLGLRSLPSTTTILIDNTTSNPAQLRSLVANDVWTNIAHLPFTWTEVVDFSFPVAYYYTLTTTTPCMVTASDAFTTGLAVTMPVTDSGVYTFCLRARDAVSNWAPESLALGQFKADNQPPRVSIESPREGMVLTTTHSPLSVRGKASDNQVVTVVSVTTGLDWSLATTNNNWQDWTYEWTLPGVDHEVLMITARARDAVGNSGETSRNVWVDTVSPSTTAPVPDSSPWVTSTVHYTWTHAVDGAGIAGYQVWVTNTQGYSEIFLVPNPPLIFTQALSEGTSYYARVRAIDGNGNIGEWSDQSSASIPDLSVPDIWDSQIISSASPYLYVVGTHLYYTNTMGAAGALFRVSGHSSDVPSGVMRVSFTEAFGEQPSDITSGFEPWQSGFYIIESGDAASGTITASVYDQVGNKTEQTYAYELDAAGPYTGMISIDNGAIYVTQTLLVSLALGSDDLGSGVAEMCINQTGEVCDAWEWESYQTTREWTLMDADGEQAVYVWYRDYLRNVSESYSDTIILDRLAPTGDIDIDQRPYTNQQNVTLTLEAVDPNSTVKSMRFSRDGEIWLWWETYKTSRSWDLLQGDGEKTVCVQYRNKAFNVSPVYCDTTLLDTVEPVGNIEIEQGEYTNQLAITLTLSATDVGSGSVPTSGVTQMCVAQAGTSCEWEDYATSKPLQLNGDDGNKVVQVQYRDGAGNESTIDSDTIILDQVAPTGDVTIGEGEYTNQPEVTLALHATDAGPGSVPTSGVTQMCVAQAGTSCEWEEYATSKSLPLSQGDGTKVVEVQYRDGAGNESTIAPDDIILDQTAPTVLITVPVQLTSGPIPVVWSASDLNPPPGGLRYAVQSKTNDGDWTGWLTDTHSTSASFEGVVLGNTYGFRVTTQDAANNAGKREASTEYRNYRAFLPLAVRSYAPFVNGSFEEGLVGWKVAQAPLPASVVTSMSDGGDPAAGSKALLLGNPNYPCNNVPVGYAAVEQAFLVPQDATGITFSYVVWSQDASMSGSYDRFEVYINNVLKHEDGNKVNTGLGCSQWRRVPTTGWKTKTIDLQPYRGQIITLSFRNYSRYDTWYNTYTYVDDVRLVP